jgi:hypothetical protein
MEKALADAAPEAEVFTVSAGREQRNVFPSGN